MLKLSRYCLTINERLMVKIQYHICKWKMLKNTSIIAIVAVDQDEKALF